jgi:sugar phosphate isomerase/epimerase
MKLGTSSPLSHAGPEDWAAKHRSLGLEAINFHLTCEDDPARVDSYVEAATRHGLEIAEVGVWKNTMDPDEEKREKAILYAIGQLELADRIGARCCVNILGARGHRWDGAYRENYLEETWDLGVKTIRRIIDAVNPKNTFFTIESMPWMVPDGPDSYLQLLEAVNRDRFAVHLDVFNWMTTPIRYFFNEEFVDECFEKLGKYTMSCHLKDVRMEEEYTIHFTETHPGGGRVNLLHLIRKAEEYNKDMPFIIEHLDSDDAYLSSIQYVDKLLNH